MQPLLRNITAPCYKLNIIWKQSALAFGITIDYMIYRLGHKFTTTLPSGEILLSTHWLQAVPTNISDKELFIDLISLEMKDYGVTLGMDFLGKYSASIACHQRKVVFNPMAKKHLNSWVSPRRGRRFYYQLWKQVKWYIMDVKLI